MATTKLGLYNNALTLLGERNLATEYEARTPRYTLDEVWNLGAVAYCLELSKPRFAHKVVALTGPTASATHGLDKVYALPSDYGTIVEAYSDGALTERVDRYFIEGRSIATNIDVTLYLRYVTNEAAMSLWTPAFAQVVAAYLAKQSAAKLNPSKIAETDKIWKERSALVASLEESKEGRRRPLAATGTLNTHWLGIFNGALRILGEEEIVSNVDDSNRRVALDYARGASDEAVDACIELARPRFAARVDRLTSSSAGTEHGYTNVFTLPANYLSFLAVYQDSALDEPISRYFIEGGSLATNYTAIHLRMLVNDSSTDDWTPAFKRLVSAYLAREVAPQILKVDEDLDPAIFAAKSTARNQALNRAQTEFDNRLQQAISLEGFKEPLARPAAAALTLNNDWMKVYNTSLELCGLDPIISADDDSERRRAIDQAINNDAVQSVLSLVPWNQAWKTVKLDSDPDIEPEWGMKEVFLVPPDMERVDMVSASEYFVAPVKYYREGSYFFADVTELWLRYTSTATVSTPSAWPTYFRNLVCAEIARRLASNPKFEVRDPAAVQDMYREYKREAMSTDVQRNPPRKISAGDWASSRHSEYSHRNGRP